MKISFHQCYDSPYSSSTRTFQFAIAMAKLGHEVRYITNNFSHHHRENSESGIKGLWIRKKIEGIECFFVNTIKYDGNGLIRMLSALATSIITLMIELIYLRRDCYITTNVPLTTAFFSIVIAKIKKSKCVLEVRDLWPDCFLDVKIISKNSLTFKALKFLEKFAYKNMDGLVVSMRHGNDYVISTFNHGKPVCYIPNPVSANYPLVKISQNNTVANGKFKILYVGSFGIDHDIFLIIDAAKYIENIYPNTYVFYLYGHGVNKNKISQYIVDSRISNVILMDPVDPSETIKLQQSASVLVSALKDIVSYSCGLNSNKVYSYLMSQRPIALSIGNVPNPIKDFYPSLQVPAGGCSDFAEAIIRAANLTKEEQKNFAKLARDYLKGNNDLKLLTDRYLNFLGLII